MLYIKGELAGNHEPLHAMVDTVSRLGSLASGNLQLDSMAIKRVTQ